MMLVMLTVKMCRSAAPLSTDMLSLHSLIGGAAGGGLLLLALVLALTGGEFGGGGVSIPGREWRGWGVGGRTTRRPRRSHD